MLTGYCFDNWFFITRQTFWIVFNGVFNKSGEFAGQSKTVMFCFNLKPQFDKTLPHDMMHCLVEKWKFGHLEDFQVYERGTSPTYLHRPVHLHYAWECTWFHVPLQPQIPIYHNVFGEFLSEIHPLYSDRPVVPDHQTWVFLTWAGHTHLMLINCVPGKLTLEPFHHVRMLLPVYQFASCSHWHFPLLQHFLRTFKWQKLLPTSAATTSRVFQI